MRTSPEARRPRQAEGSVAAVGARGRRAGRGVKKRAGGRRAPGSSTRRPTHTTSREPRHTEREGREEGLQDERLRVPRRKPYKPPKLGQLPAGQTQSAGTHSRAHHRETGRLGVAPTAPRLAQEANADSSSETTGPGRLGATFNSRATRKHCQPKTAPQNRPSKRRGKLGPSQ